MRLNKNLNLVVELDSDEHGHLYVHSTPISRNVCDKFFRVIGSAYNQLWEDELGFRTGPRYAYLMLKDVAEKHDVWNDIQKEVINEIIRLTNAILPGANGYDTLPLSTAYTRNMISDDDRGEIEGNLIFFTLALHVRGPKRTPPMMEVIGPMWGLQITALPLMDFLNSLPKLTQPENSPAVGGSQSAPTPTLTPATATIREPGSTVARPVSVPH